MYKLPAEAELLPVGGEVEMVVDADLRQTHAKIHSAGHILDLAVQRLSKCGLIQSIRGKQARGITSPTDLMSNTRGSSRMAKRQCTKSTMN